MAQTAVVTTQTDFSSGEVDTSAKRADDNPIKKTGLRQASNGRLLNSKGWQNRPGRRALFKETGRVEEIQLGTSSFFLCFGNGTLRVYNSTGLTQLFTESGRPWTNATAKDVNYAILDKAIFICFTSGVPRVLTWDGVTTFTAANYAETVTSGGQKRTFFYRLSPKNLNLTPSARTGAITVTVAPSGIFTAGHVGTRLRYCNRQILITGFTNSSTVSATVMEPLPGSQAITFGSDPALAFSLGEVVIGSVTGSRGLITQFPGANRIVVQLLTLNATNVSANLGQASVSVQQFGFTTADVVVSESSSLQVTAIAAVTQPEPCPIWDDELINALRGYPQSCFVDQGRLGFCNFAALPRAIGWSAFGLPNDLYVDAPPTAAMLELAPENSQVYYVQPGPDGSEFAFCSNAIWRIPISASNPLKPGSVGFEPVSRDGCANVQPRSAFEHIFFLSAGLSRMMAVEPTGYSTHAFTTRDLSELRTHLFVSPIAIAIPTADGTFPERYIYVLNSNGTLAVGKFTTVDGKVNVSGITGWLPWSGGGTVGWIAALGSRATFTTSYAPNSITAVSVAEVLDDTRRLDGSQLYNTQPAGLPKPGGKGPLWWIPGGTVDLMDGANGNRMMGTYVIDADGFLVPQNNAGEDFTSANLVVGQPWTATIEPFIPAVQAGQDVGQRMWPRRVKRVQIYVQNSTGFLMERLYSGQSGANLPANGTVMKQRRIATWNQDDDPTLEPPLREQSYLDRPLGRAHDPRWCVVKDTPGPLTVLEISTEVTM